MNDEKIIEFSNIYSNLTKNNISNLAPIAVVMLPEAVAFEALLQHLNGKRDRCIYKP